MTEDDKMTFSNAFYESMNTRNDLFTYAKLVCPQQPSAYHQQPPREVLFEFTGRPHFVGDELQCKCFFAVAKPYPSKNTNT